MSRQLISMFVLISILTSCGVLNEATETAEAAKEFTAGVSEIPHEKIVFLEFDFMVNCSCGCAVLEQALRQYFYTSDTIGMWAINDTILDESSNIGTLLSDAIIVAGENGLAANQLASTDLKYFESLPIKIEHDNNTILVLSADRNGIIVMETSGRTLFIEPKESWRSQPVKKEDPERSLCFYEYSYEITNYGFVDKAKIKYQDNYYP